MNTRMSKQSLFRNRKNGGFTLLELGIVVAIIIVAGLIITRKGPAIINWMSGGNESEALSTLTSGLKGSATGGDFGTGSILPALWDKYPGYFTVSGTVDAPVLTNSRGGQITAVGNGATATITAMNETPSTCSSTIQNISNSFPDAIITAGSKSWGQGTKISASDASKACSGASNTVAWTVYPGSL